MKKIKADKITTTSDRQVKVLFPREHFALIAFAAANKGMRWGDYIRSVVVEQAKKDFKEKEKIEGV
jgi:hypothetical protein